MLRKEKEKVSAFVINLEQKPPNPVEIAMKFIQLDIWEHIRGEEAKGNTLEAIIYS